MSKEQLLNLIDIVKTEMLNNNDDYYEKEIQYYDYQDTDFVEDKDLLIDNARKVKNFNHEKLLVLFRDIERMVK